MTTDEDLAPLRTCGVLLHVTSLPGPHGSGDLGPAARDFVDFLARGGQRYWQTLPINPVGLGNSPYSGLSAFAGNPLLISLEDLLARGLLRGSEVTSVASGARCDLEHSAKLRRAAVRTACLRLRERGASLPDQLQQLRARHRYWLPDYALFCAARAQFGGRAWIDWDPALARHEPVAVREASRKWADEIELYEIEQLLFDQQWRALRSHATERQVALIGDAPLFVAHDSADVWSNQAYFRLDAAGRPSHVSGAPPDQFSESGQRWGMPLYRWEVLARDDYEFWVQRLETLLERFDLVRLDHFIGFARYWEIAAEEETATHGRWQKGPGAHLFQVLQRKLTLQTSRRGLVQPRASLPLIAEDLGCVSEDVHALRDQFGLPGMRVLQFGFGGANEHLPHHYPIHCVAYTGTHDTNTIIGFLEESAAANGLRTQVQIEAERDRALAYAFGPGAVSPQPNLHEAMIRLLFASPAQTVIIPMQDWLGLGEQARMNMPGQAEGNWGFRLLARQANAELAQRMRAYAETYQR